MRSVSSTRRAVVALYPLTPALRVRLQLGSAIASLTFNPLKAIGRSMAGS